MLSVIMCYNDAAYHKATCNELTTQSQHILIVCDAEISTNLVLHYILSADDDDNLYLVTYLAEHTQL